MARGSADLLEVHSFNKGKSGLDVCSSSVVISG